MNTANRKIKILYDATIISSGLYNNTNRSGIFFVAHNILMELLARDDVEVYFYSQEFYKEAVREFFRLKEINELGVPEAEWKPIEYLEESRYGEMDAFLSPVFRVPDEIKAIKSIKKYVILHDAIPYLFREYYPEMDEDYWLKKLVETASNEECYFTDSVNTKNDFMKLCPCVEPCRFVPNPLAYDENILRTEKDKKTVFEKYNLPQDKKYVLSLCSLQPRKNILRIVRTFNQFVEKNKLEDVILILAGGMDENVEEKLNLSEVKNRVYVTGYIEDDEKHALYSNAEWFVYTSQYEGFGMPPLEAMACGCPVIASNNSSLPEVMGNSGIMIDWDSDEQHVQAYEKMYFDSEFRNECIEKALSRALQFSWKKTVDNILKTVRRNTMNLNIAWDATAVYGPMSKNRGIGNYVTGMFSAMIDMDENNHYYLFNLFEDTEFKELLQNRDRLDETYLYCGNNNDLLSNPEYKNVVGNAIKRFIYENKIDVFFVTSPFESRLFPYEKEWFGEVKTVAIVYDIIPYLFQERYFAGEIEKHGKWYLDRLEMLKNMDLCLTISESARTDLIEALGFSPEKVSTIWGAVDKRFKVLNITEEEKQELYNKFGVVDKYIMCTGGDDDRKNLAGLITAYSKMPKELIDEYQLVIVCKLSPESRIRYSQMAETAGIKGRVVLTGFVSDEELVQFYNLAHLVAFPSEYEGFGLPIVEAFACETPVLTSNNSSLVQVAGDAAVLVDPFSVESVTDGLIRALTETDLEEMVRRGKERVKLYQWEKVSEDTLNAIADFSKINYDKELKKIAMFTPLPPLYSGIADYSKDIINELSKFVDVDVYIDDGYESDAEFRENVCVLNHADFTEKADSYDEIVYQIGNSEFHTYMWNYMKQYRGVVELHDFNMHGILNKLVIDTGDLAQYGEYLMQDFEVSHVQSYINKLKNHEISIPVFDTHVNGFVVNPASKVIVHSLYNKKRLLERDFGRDVSCIKLFTKIDDKYDKDSLREKYGFSKDELIIASFGIVAAPKRNKEIIMAITPLLKKKKNIKYLVVGGDVSQNNEYSNECMKIIDANGLSDQVQFTGYVSENDLIEYMKLTDICVNLRYPYNGESSAAFARLLGMGKAIVVNRIGDFDEVPDDACIKIDSVENMTKEKELKEITKAVGLLTDEKKRQAIEENALSYAKEKLDITKVAIQYIECLKRPSYDMLSEKELKNIFESEIKRKNYSEEELGKLADTILYGKGL